MSGFNHTTTIHGNEHDYNVRTMNFDSIRKIVVNINDQDRVLNTQEIPYDEKISEEELKTLVKDEHEQRVNTLQELMKISAKLQSKPEADSNHKLGQVFLNNGMGKEAIAELKRALVLQPDYVPMMNHLGLAHMQENQFDEALAIYQKAVTLKPNYPDVRNNFGVALMNKDQFVQALQEFEKAIEFNPRYAIAHFNLAHCLVSQASAQDGADDTVKQAIADHLKQAVEYNVYLNNEYFKVAQTYLAKGQFKETKQALQETKSAILFQNGTEIYYEFYLRLKYGDEGVDRKSTEKYISKLEDILEKNPHYVDIHNDLGVAYLVQCRFLFTRAIKEFKTALALNQDYAHAKKNLKLAENEGKGFLILLRAILYF